MALPGVLEEAELIRRGDVAPVDAIQAAVARIEAVDEELGSLVYRRYDRAADEAARAAHSAPFRGVPILVKDFLCEMANEPTYQGLGLAKERDWRAPEDSVITMRLRDAGFAMLGRTNTSQLALTGTADPPGFPRTANPWGKDVTPGGSSGGSAAAVASGLVAAAHGNDGLGSIRVPASFCGLVGLKPSRGLISSAPAPEALGGVVGQGVLTRSVVDTAAMLDVLAGSVSADLYIAPRPAQSYVDALQVPLSALRIGVVIDSGSAHTTSSESSDAVRKTADVLQSLGHHVFETTVAEAFADELAELNALRSASGTAAVLTAWGSKLQQELTADDVEPFTWWTAERGRAMSAPLLASALGRLQVLTRTIVAQWERFDVLLTPACAIPAPHISWLSPTVDPETVFARNQELFAFTQAFNITGQPAIAVPATLDDRGIPIGVQLVGRPFDDSLLVKVAHQLEAHSHWPSLVENHATVPATFPRMQK